MMGFANLDRCCEVKHGANVNTEEERNYLIQGGEKEMSTPGISTISHAF